MIIQLTDNQRAIIEEATQTKYNDVRELEALKRLGPPIRENIIKGMLKRGLLEIRTDEDGGKLTLVSDMGYAAIGKAAGAKCAVSISAVDYESAQLSVEITLRLSEIFE